MKAYALLVLLLAGCASPPRAQGPIDAALRARAPTLLPEETAPAEAEARVAELLQRPLTRDSVSRIALWNNRRARAWMHELAAARGEMQQAGVLPNPETELGLRLPVEGHGRPQVDVGLDFDLREMLFLSQRKDVAQAELGAERLRIASELIGLATRARLTFLDALAAKRRLDLAEQTLRTFQAAWAARLSQEKAGNVRALDVALEKAAVEEARLAVASADEEWVVARERLNALLGLGGTDTRWTLADGPEVVDDPPELPQEDERKAIEASLAIARLQARAEAEGLRAHLAETGGWLPGLILGFHGEHDDEVWELGGHVLLELPIFDRGQEEAGIARARRRAFMEEAIALGAEVRAAVRAARAKVVASARKARHARFVVLPAWEEAAEQTLLQYNAMQLGVYELLRAQRDVLEARRVALREEIAHARARAELDAILAGRHAAMGETWTDADF